jgi:hypothetical protein
MGGQAQDAGNYMAEGTVNGFSTSTTNGDIPHHGFADGAVPSSTRNSHYVIANGSSLPMQNGAPHGVIVVNGNTQGLESSGIASRLPHGAQFYVSFMASFMVL